MRVSTSTIGQVRIPEFWCCQHCISPQIAVSFRPEGTAEMHSGLAAKQAGGAEIKVPYYLGALGAA